MLDIWDGSKCPLNTVQAGKFPSLTFAKVLVADMPLIESLADAGIHWTLEPRYEIVIGGKCLSRCAKQLPASKALCMQECSIPSSYPRTPAAP